MLQETGNLYLAVADDLARMITDGRWRTGDRVPSVRGLATERRVSPTTALAALRALERRGLVEARPKSGYFVRLKLRATAALPVTRPSQRPQPIQIQGRVGAVISASLEPGTIQLGSGLPDPAWFPTDVLERMLRQAVRESPRLLGEYGPLIGLAPLREALSRRYAEFGCTIDPDEFVVTNGCMNALTIALSAVTRPGDVVAIESPAYFGFLLLLETFGLKALEIPTDFRTGLSVEALSAALSAPGGERVRAVLLTSSHSNPTGATLPEESRRALAALAQKHDLAIVEDDIYGELSHAGERPRPIKAFDASQRVITCSSFSKSLAPGARLGWVAGARYADAIRLRHLTTSVASPASAQRAVAEYLDSGRYTRHLQRVRAKCAENVDRVADAVERHFPAGTRMTLPKGGFLLWVVLPAGYDSLELWERARAARVSIMPGHLFSVTGRYRSSLRLNCSLPWTPRVDAALATLGRLAKQSMTAGGKS
jgi:DNA-binding transcriptional MocR family regulator